MNLRKLISLSEGICSCTACHLPKSYFQMLRPPGKEYKTGGVVFLQINPGQVGFLSKAEIEERYSSKKNRDIASLKARDTKRLISLQKAFQKNPCKATYEHMREAFHKSMSDFWGWPPGKYASTIEAHGVPLNEAAITNLAQCPVPNNSYKGRQLDLCWEKWTSEIIKILQPSVIVAQGKQVWDFISKREVPSNSKIIEGLHHADRRSNLIKGKLLDSVHKDINSFNLGKYV